MGRKVKGGPARGLLDLSPQDQEWDYSAGVVAEAPASGREGEDGDEQEDSAEDDEGRNAGDRHAALGVAQGIDRVIAARRGGGR